MEKRLALNVSINYFCNQKCFFCVDDNKDFLSFLKNDIDKKVFDAISD
jgi:molybdenum cofactor biosynthesis enzyme MoaA